MSVNCSRRNVCSLLFFARRVQLLRDLSRGISRPCKDHCVTEASTSALKQLNPVELVPPQLHRYLFGEKHPAPDNCSKSTCYALELPKLKGESIVDHFRVISEAQFNPYRQLFEEARIFKIFDLPKQWRFEEGWTKYDSEGGSVKVIYPDCDILFFDVEVCMDDGQLPTMAVALGPNGWFSWCSSRLVLGEEVPSLSRPEYLIPLGSTPDKVKLIIGHNVAYDRSRVLEEYLRQKTSTRFWDTMSMGIPIYGMPEHQAPIYEKTDLSDDINGHNAWLDDWKNRVCKNSLSALHSKLCQGTGTKLNKSMQSFFVKEPITAIRECFQDLMRYCAIDVLACCEVYRAMYEEFAERFPHPATWLGMLEMCNVYLPVTSNWRKFYQRCENKAVHENKIAVQGTVRAAFRLMNDLAESRYKEDPWLWIVDWSHRKGMMPVWYMEMFKRRRCADVPFEDLIPTDVKLKSRHVPRIFGLCWGPYPLHFKYDKGWGFLVPKGGISHNYEPDLVTEMFLRRGNQAAMPSRAIYNLIMNNIYNGIGDVILGQECCSVGEFNFHKLPHPGGSNMNIGDPLAKSFYENIEAGVLWPSRFAEEFHELMIARRTTRFWGNYRARLREQIAVWFDDEGTEGAIAPAVIPAGTITRRAVHKLWLTATNPKDNEMIGTEVKSMVECPKGWYFVGADVDSQEQWIAATLGDSAAGVGRAGVTPFSNMLLAGSKADHSDLHSVVAREVGISRDKAKVLNYARLYGSGVNHAIDFLKLSGINENAARNMASKLFETTKGVSKKYYLLSKDMNEYFSHFIDTVCCKAFRDDYVFANGRYFVPVNTHGNGLTTEFEKWLISEVGARLQTKDVEKVDRDVLLSQVYDRDRAVHNLYAGGFESDTFNYLELAVLHSKPRTPVLDCRLGNALEPLEKFVPDREYFISKYKRSIINWVVQSSAVDFLHLLLVCMNWLCEEFDIAARFVISIHDEIRYMVKEDDRYRCALALVLSNMYVRAMISQKLGVNELPKSVAFFSQVDIDRVLRKEVDTVCRTPDGQLISNGEALDIDTILQKTGGTLRKRSNHLF